MTEFLETTVDKFIFKVATDRLYSPAGVWVLEEEPGSECVRLGVTDYQQQLNGDVAFAHIKTAGTSLSEGDEFAEIETIKATVSFSSPVAGEIVEINADLDLTPEMLNEQPYGEGWLAVVKAVNWPTVRASLLKADAYLSEMRSQAEEELKKS